MASDTLLSCKMSGVCVPIESEIAAEKRKEEKSLIEETSRFLSFVPNDRLPAGRLWESESPRVHACRVFGIGRLDWRASVGIEVTGATTTQRHRDFGGSRGPHCLWLPQKLWAVRGVHFGAPARSDRLAVVSSGPVRGEKRDHGP
ncbi:hypothetical protein WN51_06190 [Melipona quadrifasciata]|uniref:Uncharacterized protein n=1 Tax=Melipona quadrifasciata TaxID=166423 RepID=A0A0N0U3M2_9HYME|nr:hypothetical protein WN51_06190 [Melipona quadrifasciata]